MSKEEEPRLDIPQHIKYWKRCLLTLLPTQYTSTDSSRMTLAFFILSSLDLLGAGPDTFTTAQRTSIRGWILRCQHPHGGFCGSPNHRFPDAYYGEVDGGEGMDPANLPATYCALLALSFVDGLEFVNRAKCLKWLRRLQREDGSFGEFVTQDGKIGGGCDMRYCYVLTTVRWMLRGEAEGTVGGIEDINVEALVGHLRAGQTYDGGISESSSHEAHAGYTYCAIASLSFLNRLPNTSSSLSGPVAGHDKLPGLTNIPATIHWLVSRQVGYREEEESDEGGELSQRDQRNALAGVYKDEPLVPGLSLEDEEFIGFNGRCNKNVDTCYAFWVGGSLDILGSSYANLINKPSIRSFLFALTQHRIGGFGKHPGSPPDIYHSYLGLAALAIMKEPGLKPFDSALCCSKEQRENITRVRTEN
ncbi:terpenoid cyclases/protein prenyltransferase alpha-alpha toroid [Amylocarpus encephaloides]|uniref:Terpenoid cyclases/protein prenyltransferase alpha-alpha toroid n=1 Tax=Amylocarpus encephaloides TaxID=45428 RepID=A0A9P8C7M8_9HELO|nr:terpenoid cyclases/protein prenyltransferase alpha-alpha toroid [Amylocarpus encephaloides]